MSGVGQVRGSRQVTVKGTKDVQEVWRESPGAYTAIIENNGQFGIGIVLDEKGQSLSLDPASSRRVDFSTVLGFHGAEGNGSTIVKFTVYDRA